MLGNTTVDQAKDTAFAITLILLLVAWLGERPGWIVPAIVVILAAMIWPRLFLPAARLWFGLSHLIGTIASKVLLSVIFFVVATPMGLLRRLLGADAMRRKGWKRGTDSVFVPRDHVFTAEDLERPY